VRPGVDLMAYATNAAESRLRGFLDGNPLSRLWAVVGIDPPNTKVTNPFEFVTFSLQFVELLLVDRGGLELRRHPSSRRCVRALKQRSGQLKCRLNYSVADCNVQ
jgi:hypothetical protein